MLCITYRVTIPLVVVESVLMQYVVNKPSITSTTGHQQYEELILSFVLCLLVDLHRLQSVCLFVLLHQWEHCEYH